MHGRRLGATGIGLLLALAAIAAQAAQGSTTGSRTYRWVDESGVTHYGDVVPPQYASQGRAELNRQGVTVREIPAQMSEAEAARAREAAGEQARRRQHDQFLLSTYTRAADIEQLRDERLALIDGQIRLTRDSIESVEGRLAALAGRMSGFRPYSANASARRLPDQLAEEVVRTLYEKRSLEEGLVTRETEKTETRAQFERDLTRYRELMAARQPR